MALFVFLKKDWHWVHQDFFYPDENPQMGGNEQNANDSDNPQLGIDFFF